MAGDTSAVPINGLRVSRYRTFESLALEGFGRSNVICGPNNAGKSSLLSLLRLVALAPEAVGSGSAPVPADAQAVEPFQLSIPVPLPSPDRGLLDGVRLSHSPQAAVQRMDAVFGRLEGVIWFHLIVAEDRMTWDRRRTSKPILAAIRSVTRSISGTERGDVFRAFQTSDEEGAEVGFLATVGDMIGRPSVLSVSDVRRSADQPLTDDELWRFAEDAAPTTSGGRQSGWTETFELILRDVFGSDVRYVVVPRRNSGDIQLFLEDQHDVPLGHVGAGVREVVALAFKALTTPGATVLAIEEPENCLHPTAVRKLIRALLAHTDVQLFVSTHSAGVVNTEPDCLVHVRREGARSWAETVDGDARRYAAVRSLGYQPSDLVLTPCAVWVEGPSDREYLRTWLREHHDLEDGIDFNIMFTGGALATHLTTTAEALVEDVLVAIRRLSRRCVILADSDRSAEGAPLKAHVARFEEELAEDPHGLCVVTRGREVENYLDPDVVDTVLAAKGETPLDRTDVRFCRVISSDSKFEKLDFARRYLKLTTSVPEAAREDLARIAEFIRRSPEVD